MTGLGFIVIGREKEGERDRRIQEEREEKVRDRQKRMTQKRETGEWNNTRSVQQ